MNIVIKTLRALSYICFFMFFMILLGTAGASDCGMLTIAEILRNFMIAFAFFIGGVIL